MPRLVVIDDNFLARELVAGFLRDAEYEVLTAATGVDGLRAAQSFSPDLILTDIVMPEMDGLEFIRALRAGGSKVPVVAMSAGGMLSAKGIFEAAKSLGVSEILVKPFGEERLYRAVAHGLAELG